MSIRTFPLIICMSLTENLNYKNAKFFAFNWSRTPENCITFVCSRCKIFFLMENTNQALMNKHQILFKVNNFTTVLCCIEP